jgi:RimJ/RimL family protein N-acetyltransferase
VVAKCDPDNAPSVRVLEKIGMTRIGQAITASATSTHASQV